jgi:hypothetical protein
MSRGNIESCGSRYSPEEAPEKSKESGSGSGLSATQVKRPNQVLSRKEIETGDVYEVFWEGGIYQSHVLITSKPSKKDGMWIVKCRIQTKAGVLGVERRVPLCDYGIIPYKKGEWNSANWWKKTSMKVPKDKVLTVESLP